MTVTLRPFADGDLDALFAWESDPRAVQMAAFTRANPTDRRAFDTHYERVRSDPANTLLAIDEDGEFVGTIGSFTLEGDREVTYWIAPARWGRGIASRALREFLAVETTRPLYGRVAAHNAASAKVLVRAGFVEVRSEPAFAPGVGGEVVEHTYRLDRGPVDSDRERPAAEAAASTEAPRSRAGDELGPAEESLTARDR